MNKLFFVGTKVLITSIIIICLFSCKTIRPYEYLKFNENQIDTFVGTFTKDSTDIIYKRVEGMFPSLAVADNFKEKYKIIYKTYNIEGHKAFYTLNTKDSFYYDASFSQNHFLSSALIFENGKVYLAPAYDLNDLYRLKFSDFKFIIPEKVTRRDSLNFKHKKKETILYNFRFENLIVAKKTFKNCLVIDLIEKWPDATYNAKVWLHKKYGVMKWIRTTGRTDNRIL